MEVAIKTTLSHEANGTEYKLNTVYRNGVAIAHVVCWNGEAKTYGVSDSITDAAFSQAKAHFVSLSGWTNHGKTVR